MPGGFVCSASMKGTPTRDVRSSFAANRPLRKLFSKAQRAFYDEHAPEGLSLEVLERELMLKALDMARGNKSQAARLLGLTRRTLYSRMERHGLRKPGEGEEGGDDEAEGASPEPAAGARPETGAGGSGTRREDRQP